MARKTRRAITDYDASELDALEQLLTRSFHPVEMRPDVRTNLHTRLSRSPIPPKLRLTIMQYVVLSLGAVAASSLVVVAFYYTTRSLLSALGYLQDTRRV